VYGPFNRTPYGDGSRVSAEGTAVSEVDQEGQLGQGLAGRRALVPGAGSGIGLACARALATAGARVMIGDVNAEAAERAAREVGGEHWVIDLADTHALDGLTLDVDILINNAGFQHVAPIEEFPPDTFRAMLRVMLEAPFLLVRAALPHMYEQGFGRVINISSVHGLRASPYKSAYVTAKHGLEGLSKVVALEGGGRGVTSNCVNPGYVRTPLVEKQIADQAAVHGISEDEVVERIMLTQPAIKRLVDPSEVADLVVWLAGPTAGFVNGASYLMDGGWTAR
jgi:3-hydroxybutyrate dehydrogenase